MEIHFLLEQHFLVQSDVEIEVKLCVKITIE